MLSHGPTRKPSGHQSRLFLFEYDFFFLADVEVVDGAVYIAEAFAPRVDRIDLISGELEVVVDDWSLFHFYGVAFDGTYLLPLRPRRKRHRTVARTGLPRVGSVPRAGSQRGFQRRLRSRRYIGVVGYGAIARAPNPGRPSGARTDTCDPPFGAGLSIPKSSIPVCLPNVLPVLSHGKVKKGPHEGGLNSLLMKGRYGTVEDHIVVSPDSKPSSNSRPVGFKPKNSRICTSSSFLVLGSVPSCRPPNSKLVPTVR